MRTRPSQTSTLLLLVIVLAVSYLVFNYIGISTKLVIAVIGIVAFGVAFVNIDVALIMLIFSMLLSPELTLGHAGGREVMIRADDVFLFVVLLGWLARMAINKELALLRGTPLNQPILLYIAVCVIATLFGILRGYVGLTAGFFYTLKYIEYFFLFFLVANTIKSRRQVRVFLYSFLAVFALISLYAFWQHFRGVERVSTPFEGKGGEANTLGGYLVVMIVISLSLFFHLRRRRLRVFLGASLCLALPALLFTLSRGSWVAFIPAYCTLMLLMKRGRSTLVAGIAVVVMFAPFIFPREVKERIEYTFEDQTQHNVLGKQVTLDEATAARIETLAMGVETWKSAPFIGRGVGSAGPAYDNQYARVLVETGTLGALLFCLILIMLFRVAMEVRRRYADDDFALGLSTGFIAALVAMLFHSFSAATFIIIRIVEPFWFLAAMVVSLPELNEAEETGISVTGKPDRIGEVRV